MVVPLPGKLRPLRVLACILLEPQMALFVRERAQTGMPKPFRGVHLIEARHRRIVSERDLRWSCTNVRFFRVGGP
jgi:hypothetical protein